MTERQLAARWQVSCRTLQRWRAERYGPGYILIGGSVRYDFAEVQDYEARMHQGGGARS